MKRIVLPVLMLPIIALMGMAQEEQSGLVNLFNGKDMSQWENLWTPSKWLVASTVTLQESDPSQFEIQEGEGIMVNGDGKTCNILSKQLHGDCQLHIEFNVPEGSNSGVYFQGLYEIQVFDSYGKEEVQHSDCGGIYQRWDPSRGEGKEGFEGHPPRVNASKAPGEWQSFDVIFRAPRFDEQGNKTENARFVVVKHNGVVVHNDVELKGRTRASLSEDQQPEALKGPLMLQGDHGPVAYRNIQLIHLNLD